MALTQSSSLNMGSTINAMSLSPDRQSLAVVGRELLKIVGIENNFLTEKRNLRVGRMNLNYSSIDVQWHPHESHNHLLATAATNGAVVLWNSSKSGSKQERVLSEHQRTVNRICWHPTDPNLLISGSQDGTIRLWDVSRGHCITVFDGRAEAVRDVQFSPFLAHYFAACFDNGTLQVWDIRKPSSWERQIAGHQGPVLAVDWHAEDRFRLATGSRDRTIKVWDLNNVQRPLHTIQTIAAVGRVKWRPKHRDHITSAASLMDFNIHVWDINRPYVPMYILSKHRDVVTGLSWDNSGQTLTSCSKDQFLMCTDSKAFTRPYRKIRGTGIAWNIRNEMAVINDFVDRRDPEVAGSVVLPIQSSRERGMLRVYHDTKNIVAEGCCDPNLIEYFAVNYRLHGPYPAELCEHNHKIAKIAGREQLAQMWKTLKVLFEEPQESTVLFDEPLQTVTEELDSRNDNHGTTDYLNLPEVPGPQIFIDESHNFDDNDKNTPSSSLPSSTSNLFMDSHDQIFPSPAQPTPSLPTPSSISDVSSVGLAGHLSGHLSDNNFSLSHPHHHHPLLSRFDAAASPSSMSASLAPSVRSPLPPPLLSHTPNNKSEPRPSRYSSPDRSLLLQFGASFLTDMSMKDNHPSAAAAAGLSSSFLSPSLHWLAEPMAHDALEFYAEQGDVQTCVAIVTVLGDRITVDSRKIESWAIAYIELLQRLELWVAAADTIRTCKLDSIKQMNQKGTTIWTSCPHCGKPMASTSGAACDNCGSLASWCSICQQPVRGLFLWCQGCGHGGHMKHVMEWFSSNSQCPTGCSHACSFAP
eukprot:GILK01009135.1.p1 GENE.GILK01009135.1~~GILK01009135.1.p1  ORF type:complete len:835 (-),score=98.21 GILK01009135.1:161-2581(-)